jgi:hypothetical protein
MVGKPDSQNESKMAVVNLLYQRSDEESQVDDNETLRLRFFTALRRFRMTAQPNVDPPAGGSNDAPKEPLTAA